MRTRSNGVTRFKQGVPVTTRAVIQRINRKLRADNRSLITTRGRMRSSLNSDYCVIDHSHNVVVGGLPWDPAALAKKLGVLRPYEYVSDEP